MKKYLSLLVCVLMIQGISVHAAGLKLSGAKMVEKEALRFSDDFLYNYLQRNISYDSLTIVLTQNLDSVVVKALKNDLQQIGISIIKSQKLVEIKADKTSYEVLKDVYYRQLSEAWADVLSNRKNAIAFYAKPIVANWLVYNQQRINGLKPIVVK